MKINLIAVGNYYNLKRTYEEILKTYPNLNESELDFLVSKRMKAMAK